MGCVQSLNRHDRRVKRYTGEPICHEVQPEVFRAVHEFEDADDGQVREAIADEGLLTPTEAKFFDADEEEADLCDSPLSLDGYSALVSSAIAEMASSQSDGSSDELERPISPELALSPNPGSPAHQHGRSETLQSRMQERGFVGRSIGNTAEFKSAVATPVMEAVTPSSELTSPERSVLVHASSAVRKSSMKSRLVEVSDLRRQVMCQQLFGVWRTSVARDKYDRLRSKLEGVGKASELVLEENSRLKSRLLELESAITVLNAASDSRRTVSTGTEDMVDPVTPPSEMVRPSAFATPAASMFSPSSRSEFVSPYTAVTSRTVVPVSIATPPREDRRSWQEYLRPSNPKSPLKERQLIESSSLAAPRIDKERLKSISEDLDKLSKSISLGRRGP